MPVLTSAVDTASETYQTNRKGLLDLLAEHEEHLPGGPRRRRSSLRRAAPGPGQAAGPGAHRAAARPGRPFLELSPLAAWGTQFNVGASIVTGIGVVSGVECVVIAHDPTVRGGTMNPYTLRKNLRALEIARMNRLPLVNLVESGGADLPTQADLFVPAGQIFHDLTELSAMGIPTIALVFGNSTAGGAYVPGMCDYSVMVDKRAKVFLGGPPLVKMATGEESDDEELGGAAMHSRVSGLSDYFATDEPDCIRIGRQIVADLNWRKLGPGPAGPPTRPPRRRGSARDRSVDLRMPFDPREVIARIVDGSRFDEYKPLYGTSLVTGWASVHGYPIGILANAGASSSWRRPRRPRSSSCWPTRRTPAVFLQNTTGYMVGRDYEQGGIIKDGAKMINAVTNSAVPHLTITSGRPTGRATTACPAGPTGRGSSSPGRTPRSP